MIRVVCFVLSLLPLSATAQFSYTLDQSISVEDLQGNNLPFAWAGGLNAAQFNTMDLNADGTDDLVLFDRMANKVITFLASENTYIPAPDYENLFPAELYSWILLRDYDCDGKKDLFTGHTLGIKVFNNVSSGSGLAWEQYIFPNGFPDPESNVLMTEGATTDVNLQLQPDDLPSISDIDGDGDLDIFNIQYMGHTVEFHQNLSVENNGACGLEFKRITRSWGDFRECSCGVFAFNNESCPANTGGRTKHAGGKSLMAIDINGDQQQDLVFSEAECTQSFLLRNTGTNSDPVITTFESFPQNDPVNLSIFPAVFHEDVDFDGKKDLLAIPNIFAKEFFNTNLQQSTWLYKNTGSAANPAFTFVRRNFIQGEMIDVGDNAVPAFLDYDGDEDFDMLISSHSSDQYTSRIFLFENRGSVSVPAFRLISDDYLGFSTSRLFNLKIQFADVNSDGTQDLVFTATNFEDGATNLFYVSNNSQMSLDLNGSSVTRLDFSLTSSENIYLTDLSGDGRPDILAGRSEGNLEYWKNTGIGGVPAFALEEESFLGYSRSPLLQNPTVALSDLDADGNVDAIIGDQNGNVAVIENFRNTTDASPEYRLVYNEFLNTYTGKNLGGKTWPVIINLFNTNKPSVVVGNGLGGVHILRHDDGSSLPERPQVHIYPNPVNKSEQMTVQPDRQGTMEIFSVLGQQLSTPVRLRAHEPRRYTLPPLAAGLYLLRFTSNKKSHTQRFVVK